jgi:aromatic-L-amino-acid decarboxylase
MSPEEFRALGHRTIDFIADYMRQVEQYPVLSRVKPGDIAAAIPEHPPEGGLADWNEVFADLNKTILPGLTHWQSPNFFAFFPCSASGPGIIGEMLSAGLNVNGMLWATSPAATELETRVLDWMAEMLNLPEAFRSESGTGGGCIQGTASESTLIALLAARQRAQSTGTGQRPAPLPSSHLTLYASTQAHSSIIKAAMIVGLARSPQDRTHLRLIGTTADHEMRPDLLGRAIREDLSAGHIPAFVCATVGTTSSTAVDPLLAIAKVIRDTSPSAWLHVDAAHSGAACICPEFRTMLAGVEHADSLCFNPHKWLLTNFDCDCFWTRDRAALTGALSINPEYLRNQATQSGQVIDYRDWQIPLGRRFRALKLWLVIRHYGVEGLRAHIREHIRLAELFESCVREDDRFELAAPRTVNLICFRLRGDGPGTDARNKSLMDRLNASGKLYLTHTTLPDAQGQSRIVLRMAIGATPTQEHHVRAAWDLIREAAGAVP